MNLKVARDQLNTHVKDLIELCPHCNAKTHIEALWNDYHILKNNDVEFYFVFRCKPCRKLLLKTFYLEQNKFSREENLKFSGWNDKFPPSLDDQLSNEEKEFVPNDILDDYSEALKCRSIAAHRAGCAMFRRALQSSLVSVGANPKLDLVKQIESLPSLPSDIKDWAHQIRILGNWGAHPDADNLKNVDSDDVIETHDFMSKFILYMFIMPAKVKLSREKRENKLKEANEN